MVLSEKKTLFSRRSRARARSSRAGPHLRRGGRPFGRLGPGGARGGSGRLASWPAGLRADAARRDT
jgi:hypothetical protein